MSVIIRLQNLPWSANALDIRQYFHGLSIPEGGVHIVGGEQGDAFIAFSTDEDARQAFNLNNGKIKEVQIKLMLSSRTEMQKVIEAARNQSLAAFMQASPAQIPSAVPPILPSVIPSAMPDAKKDDKDNGLRGDKRDKRRSRSRSRERKDRERDRRDRRRRDRSRSRSRERRDRRRRDRSRSRDRTRSKERDRRSKDRKSLDAAPNNQNASNNKDTKIGVWEPPAQNDNPAVQNLSLLGAYPPAAAILAAAAVAGSTNAIMEDRIGFQSPRDNFGPRWNPNHNIGDGPNSFPSRRFQNHNDDRFNDQNQGRIRPGIEPFKNNYDNRPGFGSRPMKGGEFLSPRFNDRPERHQTDHPNCCVQMHSYYGGFGEVRRFFQGIFIHNTGIKFINDDFGKRTGVCYIKCAYPEGKEEALARSGSMLKHQVVEITHLDDDEFNSVPDRYQPELQFGEDEGEQDSRNFRGKNISKYFNSKNSNGQSQSPPPKIFSCLAVEDLPTYAKEQDILKMFSEYPLMSIILINKPRKVHVAYVQFGNSDDAKTALQETGKHVVDGKPVTVKPCRDDVFENVQREQSEIPEEPEKSNSFMKSDCVLLSRLPLKTNDRDISDFFSDIGIIPIKIHLLSNSMGFVGEAYCEFSSTEEAMVALEKNGKPLGSSIVSVKPIERSDMENMLGIHVISDSPSPPQLSQQHSLRAPLLSIGMGQPPRQFFPRNNYQGPGPRGPSFLGGPRPRRFVPNHMQGDEPFGPPGCTVLMENVPYKATVDEILQFFDGYDIPADNILRRYNPNGKPSGESKVIFKNSDDAYQAVNQKQEEKIRDRTVYLTLI